MAFSSSWRSCSCSSLSSLDAGDGGFSRFQRSFKPAASAAQPFQFVFHVAQPVAGAMVALSLTSAWRSISRCEMRRSSWSISIGMEPIWMRSAAPASSIRSMALSGRKRSLM